MGTTPSTSSPSEPTRTRIDHTATPSITDGRTINLPCRGVFEMEHGKIKVWRDYFDLAT